MQDIVYKLVPGLQEGKFTCDATIRKSSCKTLTSLEYCPFTLSVLKELENQLIFQNCCRLHETHVTRLVFYSVSPLT